MSTLSVTTVTTGLSTTDLTLNTANTGAGDIVIQSDGLGMVLSGNSTSNTVDIAPNGHVVIANTTVNTFVLTSAGALGLGTSTPIGSGYKLHTYGSVPGIAIQTSTADGGGGGGWIDFLTAGSVVQGNIYYDQNAGYMEFGTAANGVSHSPRMRIDAAGNVSVTSNNLIIGSTYTIAPTGYMYLPNGLKINWGFSAANNTTGNATFSSAFASACYGVMTSGANSLGNTSYVTGVNTTVAQIRSSSATAALGNVYYIAYGV